MTELVSIIILNWNRWKDTIECVESCSKLSYPTFRILIVDNGSTDGSEAILRKRFPDIEFIQTHANLGFAGNNVGIRYALEQGADYVWLLNNDTVVDVEALSALVQVAESDKTLGMVGSKIFYHDNPRLLWYAGAELDPHRPYRLAHRGVNEEERGHYDEIVETGYVTGCSLLARREMIDSIGLLDEDFFLYFEDTDWNARAKAAGWKLVYNPHSLVYHKVSMSVGGQASPLMYYYSARNLLYFVKRHFPGRFLPALIFVLYEYVLVNLKKRRIATAVAALQGVGDFFMTRMGQKS